MKNLGPFKDIFEVLRVLSPAKFDIAVKGNNIYKSCKILRMQIKEQ
jgi:hypothetical protein